MVTDDNKLQGFADRLNEKLDEAGAPGWDSGRQKWVSNFFKKDFKISEIGVRKWMMAEGMPDTKKLDVIAAKLNTTVNYLLSGDGDSKEPKPKYKEDRQDIHDEIEALPSSRMDEIRLAIEIVKSRIPRKPAAVIPMSASERKGKQKK